MAGIEGNIRYRRREEHLSQQRDVRSPVLTPEEIAIRKEIEEKAKLERILQNKIIYQEKSKQDIDEQKLQPQIGLPEMPEKEALQEQIQANQHQNQVFAGVKATERYRMGHMQEELARARAEHGFEPPVKQADQIVLEAANKPVQDKNLNLNKELTKEEKEWKSVFYSNKSFDEKVKWFKDAVKKKKHDLKLSNSNQIKRAKRLAKEVDPNNQRKVYEIGRFNNCR